MNPQPISELWADESQHCYWCDGFFTDGQERPTMQLWFSDYYESIGQSFAYGQYVPFHSICRKPLESFLRNV